MVYTDSIGATDPMNDNRRYDQMKIEELTQKQIEKAKALATNEERLDYLNECGVELDDDMMAEVAGGGRVGEDGGYLIAIDGCKKGPNKGGPHKFEKTGKRKRGRWLGIMDDIEYRCVYCGHTEWAWR